MIHSIYEISPIEFTTFELSLISRGGNFAYVDVVQSHNTIVITLDLDEIIDVPLLTSVDVVYCTIVKRHYNACKVARNA